MDFEVVGRAGADFGKHDLRRGGAADGRLERVGDPVDKLQSVQAIWLTADVLQFEEFEIIVVDESRVEFRLRGLMGVVVDLGNGQIVHVS